MPPVPQQTYATLPADAPEEIRALFAAGEALHGEEWRRPLAVSLGPYHPDGPRESIDPRLVSRWAAGSRPIPAWALRGLRTLLAASEARFAAAQRLVEQACACDRETMEHQ